MTDMKEETSATVVTPKPTEVKPPTPTKKDSMLTCTILLRMDKFGSSIVKDNVTPAEMLLLVAEHKANANALPITNISNETTVERSDRAELLRLRSIYAGNKIKALFPGASPQFPKTFKEAQQIGMELDPAEQDNTFKLA